MTASKYVALAFQMGAPHQERITRGILDYSQLHGPWNLVFSPEASLVPLEMLTQWPGDGIIAMLETPQQIELAQSSDVPVVNVGSSIKTPRLPTVTVDNRAVGRMAASHLLDRGFRRFGYYGPHDLWYSQERLQGFREIVMEAGFESTVCKTDSGLHTSKLWVWDREELEHWLSGLQLPVGVFAAHDYRARMIMEIAVRLGLSVPRDIAIVGVDDDPIVCEFCSPTLSSVRQNGSQVGFHAAKCLGELMSGRMVPDRTERIAPLGLIERESTRTMAVDDPVLQQAVELVGRHFGEGIDVAWLATKLGVSRRWLERLSRQNLGCTPHQYICQVRVNRAKALLSKVPRWKLKRVAAECGFHDVRRLNIVFTRATGKSPRNFRKSIG